MRRAPWDGHQVQVPDIFVMFAAIDNPLRGSLDFDGGHLMRAAAVRRAQLLVMTLARPHAIVAYGLLTLAATGRLA